MHGKLQREPAHRAASPSLTITIGIYVDHRRHLANMIIPKCVANVSLQLVLHADFRGWAKTRQPFSAVQHRHYHRMHVFDDCLAS